MTRRPPEVVASPDPRRTGGIHRRFHPQDRPGIADEHEAEHERQRAEREHLSPVTAGRFPEAAIVDTADTIYLGFGLEGITGADSRNAILGRAMNYLLR